MRPGREWSCLVCSYQAREKPCVQLRASKPCERLVGIPEGRNRSDAGPQLVRGDGL